VSRATSHNRRGFGVYGMTETRNGDRVTVSESSLALEGAHVRIYAGRESIFVDAPAINRAAVPPSASVCLHLSVAQAKVLHDALGRWIADAEDGLLTEPATREAEEETDVQ
jgi:hypothetical protein